MIPYFLAAGVHLVTRPDCGPGCAPGGPHPGVEFVLGAPTRAASAAASPCPGTGPGNWRRTGPPELGGRPQRWPRGMSRSGRPGQDEPGGDPGADDGDRREGIACGVRCLQRIWGRSTDRGDATARGEQGSVPPMSQPTEPIAVPAARPQGPVPDDPRRDRSRGPGRRREPVLHPRPGSLQVRGRRGGVLRRAARDRVRVGVGRAPVTPDGARDRGGGRGRHDPLQLLRHGRGRLADRAEEPVFADIEPDTFNIDPAKLEAAITSADEGDHPGPTSTASPPTWTRSMRSPRGAASP